MSKRSVGNLLPTLIENGDGGAWETEHRSVSEAALAATWGQSCPLYVLESIQHLVRQSAQDAGFAVRAD